MTTGPRSDRPRIYADEDIDRPLIEALRAGVRRAHGGCTEVLDPVHCCQSAERASWPAKMTQAEWAISLACQYSAPTIARHARAHTCR
jgi:hypothetical protein